MKTILYSPKFEKLYKKIPLRIKLIAERKEEIFKLDPFDPRLKTHKLTGGMKEYYSFFRDVVSRRPDTLVLFFRKGKKRNEQ